MSRVQYSIVLVVLYFGISLGSNCNEDSDISAVITATVQAQQSQQKNIICENFQYLTITVYEIQPVRTIDSIQLEEPCVAAGGICTIAEDCPEGSLSRQRGLCPKQQDRGVECCYGISRKESRCIKHGGVCISLKERCNPQLMYNGPNDCAEDQKCCILTL